MLLNNCPKLTHLSLTGVQAFLRDELLTFCREAPPEFNEHQRDVFCVFSGPGVGRLREFLNQQKAHAAANDALSVTTGGSDRGDGSVMGDGSVVGVVGDAGPGEDESPDSDGVSTPVMAVDVAGNVLGYTPGATPAIPTPPPQPQHGIAPPPLLTQALQNQAWQSYGHHTNHSNLSQSAPATTGPVFWNIPPPPPQGLGIGTSHHYHSNSAGSHFFGPPSSAQAAGAQQVTGMMGATVLHEVDEEDDGDDDEGMDGSEIMDSR